MVHVCRCVLCFWACVFPIKVLRMDCKRLITRMKGTEVPNPRRSSACDSGMCTQTTRPRALIRAAVGVAT